MQHNAIQQVTGTDAAKHERRTYSGWIIVAVVVQLDDLAGKISQRQPAGALVYAYGFANSKSTEN